MWRVTGTQHQHQAGAPPQPGDPGFGSPSAAAHAMTRGSEVESLARTCLLDLGRTVLPEPPPSDSRVPAPAPPPPAPAPSPPAPARVPERRERHDIRANPKVQLAQARRFAKGVLEYYNKRKKIKFELLDAQPVISIPEPRCCYTHINFTARSSKEGSQEQLFFAEIYHCSKRRAPCGFIVTCCEPLGPYSTVGQKFLKPDGTSAVRKNADFSYCFACTKDILHPKGENYVAGHCTIPCVYDYVR